MGTPNTKNHTLGKGSVFLDKLDPNTGNPTGERHLGNAPALGFNMTLEMLEHFSSMEKIRSKDVKMVIEAAPKFTFTLDEPVADNLGLTFMGSAEDVTESANDARTKTFTGVNANRYYDLGVRNVGVWVLPYKNGTAILNEGATVSGAVGEGVILQVVGDVTSGTLYIKTVTPGFVLDEAITDDGGTPGAAECAAVESFDTAALDVFDTATPATKL
nr:hypothetical protein [Phycisphaerae bacterium]NIR62335.1 hypothetical protein [candidate division Zixibacteria bacterium]NIT54933.1 hypothetical protein [Fodinibius sp.]NIW43347.1 hypothetical protein [Gammaproteobacteria bacterium]NIU12568.1 hypothetical protein [candidate division Zixibacteria bacterium]